MTLLPMVARELRVASRKARSYWLRLPTAGLAVLLLGGTVWFGRVGWHWSGPETFQLISWYGFIYCLFGGALATADCLSSERRENTLGLLFLTDLAGYDIALGKLCAHALTSFFSVMAILPVLAIPIIMGGVPYEQVGRVAVSLVTTLFLSMSVGLFISVLSRNAFRATTVALLVMLVLGLCWPAVGEVLNRFHKWPILTTTGRHISPLYTQMLALSGSARWNVLSFWPSVLTVGLVALAGFSVTCWLLPRSWRDAAGQGAQWTPASWFRALRHLNLGSGTARRSLRLLLIDRNPFSWLVGRERVSSPGLLLLSVTLVCAGAWWSSYFARFARAPNAEDQALVWLWTAILLHLFLLAKVSSFACERLGDDRQSGALELLLCTPLSVPMILRGQWQGLRRQLLGPALIVGVVHGLFLLYLITIMFGTADPAPQALRTLLITLRNLWTSAPEPPWEASFAAGCVLGAAAILVSHWVTLGWVGMWMALRLPQPRFAPWVTLAIVLATPWIVFIAAIITLLEFESTWTESRWLFFCLRLALGLNCLSDLVLSFWASRNLRRYFRTAAADRFQFGTAHTWALARRALWPTVGVCAGLALVLGIFHSMENRRGLRAWNDLQVQLAAKGESLLPERPPAASIDPEQNFAQHPVFTGLLNWTGVPQRPLAWGQGTTGRPSLNAVSLSVNGRPRGYVTWDQHSWRFQQRTDLETYQKQYRTLGLIPATEQPTTASADVLRAFSRFHEPLEQLRAASQRPFCRYGSYPPHWNAFPPHLQLLANVSEVLRYRASAELAEGQVESAFEDVKLCLYLAESLREEQTSASQNLRRALLNGALQPIWEGLADGRWPQPHLLWFQHRLSGIDLLSQCPTLLRAEMLNQMEFWARRRADRARHRGVLSVSRVFSPVGWTYENAAGLYQFYQEYLTGLIVPQDRRAFPDKVERALTLLPKTGYFPRGAEFTFRQVMLELAWGQTALDQGVLTCALERYRLDHGEYPANLNELQPAYVERVPRDIMDGQPLRYRILPSGQFVFYSVGWNGQDDRGVGRNELDWVWKY